MKGIQCFNNRDEADMIKCSTQNPKELNETQLKTTSACCVLLDLPDSTSLLGAGSLDDRLIKIVILKVEARLLK